MVEEGAGAMHIVDMVYFWARTMRKRPAFIQPEASTTGPGR
jgi:hypothetical protein